MAESEEIVDLWHAVIQAKGIFNSRTRCANGSARNSAHPDGVALLEQPSSSCE